MSAPLDPIAPGAAPRGGLARAWGALALLLLAAAPLGVPYEAALFARAGGFSPLADPGRLLLERGVEAVLFGLPVTYVGLRLARPLGWGAPWLAGERPWRALPRVLGGPLLAGVVLGALVALASLAAPRLLPGAFPEPAGAGLAAPAAWKGALSAFAAGVDEEIFTRLFLLSLVARIAVRVLGRGTPPPSAATWAANAVAALAFGAMHFANVAVLGLPHSFANLAFVLLLNGGLGLACGWFFVTQGLEAAMAAHFAAAFVAHGVLPALDRIL